MPNDVVVAKPGLPPWLARLSLVLACIYLVGVFSSAVAPRLPNAVLPRVPRYFTQIACLFPSAATHSIDYRLEVWDCAAEEYRELDFRPLFPMHPEDKENRFQRTAHFFRQHRPVMRALERYVIEEGGRGVSSTIGGIRVSSLRLPLPGPGEPVRRWQREPLTSHPENLQRHWYYTPVSRREAFCSGSDPDA